MKNTFNVSLITFSLCLSFLIAQAQNGALKIEAKVNTNRSVDFNFQKTDPGTFTVVINFNTLNNALNPGTLFTAREYSGKLLSLTPTVKEQGIGYSYSTFYIRGKLKPKYDANFIYLLPYKKDAKVQVAELKFLGATYFGDTTPEDWKAFRFYTKQQDTVTSIRKGVVVEIKDLYDNNENSEVAYTSRTNELTIEHPDGTLARYSGFKKGSFAVKLGQTVYPATALGLNSKYDINGSYNITILISYLKTADPENKSTSLSKSKSFYGFVNPHFMTGEHADDLLVSQQTYTSISTPEAIQKEMSKREVKQLIAPKK